MIIGAWGHGPSQKFGDVDFGPGANRDMFERQLRWYDHYLKGEDNGIDREPPIEIFYMGVNKWQHAEEWPLPDTKFTPYYLGGARGAVGRQAFGRRAPISTSTIRIIRCRRSGAITAAEHRRLPVQKTSGRSNHAMMCWGIRARPDGLLLAIAGPVQMKLFAATDGRDTDWMIKLVDVYPDGFAMNVAEGMLRARFRNGVDKMELLQPSQVYEYEIEMAGTANVFQPGHRIRVDITSSNFPQFDRNPNTGEDLGASRTIRDGGADSASWRGEGVAYCAAGSAGSVRLSSSAGLAGLAKTATSSLRSDPRGFARLRWRACAFRKSSAGHCDLKDENMELSPANR